MAKLEKLPSQCLPSSYRIADEDLRLKHVIQTLPSELFLKDSRRAWGQVLTSTTMLAIGYFVTTYSPWYLLPLAWVFTGTALTGFFVIGHDCGHRSFSNRKWLNNLVGHLVFLPLIYPFHGWRIGHNYHHKHTNKIDFDNAWQPWRKEVYEDVSWGVKRTYQAIRGKLWWIGSIFHWVLVNFDWNRCTGKDREKMRFSTFFALIGSFIGLTILIVCSGWWGLVNYWLMPWIVYHFWLSTFTIVHHTDKNIPFRIASEWREAISQLTGTVHCDYPSWVEFLCHDINVHVPHHICTAIPSYKLRDAHSIIKDNWGEHIKEKKFNLELIKEIIEECHLYDTDNFYVSFNTFEADKRAAITGSK